MRGVSQNGTLMRSIIQATVVATFGTLLLVATADAENVHVRLRFAGAVTQTQVDTNGDGVTANTHHFRAKGHTGRAVIIGQSETAPAVPGFLLGCPPEFELAFAFIGGGANVFTFNDLSTLRTVISDGVFCFDLDTNTAEVTNTQFVVGGSGRFEGANGLLSFESHVSTFSPTMTPVFQEGRITGDIQIP